MNETKCTGQVSLFDLLPEDEAAMYKPMKSTDWKWTFADYPKEKNGLKVFSCFACGGGSTMGYKLAGCEVVGCCEIDPKMNEIYIKNHNPRHNFRMDIREFNKIPNEELPPELFNLDILDGSPPCTTFSMAGEREESWGKKKKFREGQAEQTLDDLSFVFIETVAKLRPKCMIMENVEGLLRGEAWAYVQRIYAQLNQAGYTVGHWLLKGQHMGVPQKRHRVFFVAFRNDIPFDPHSLDMAFNYEPILYGEFKSKTEKMANGKMAQAIRQRLPGEKVEDVMFRLYGVRSGITHRIVELGEVYPTQTAGHADIWTEDGNHPSDIDVTHAQTFPEDYDFGTAKVEYICGMSVPPVMIKRIVQRLIESGVFSYKAVVNK